MVSLSKEALKTLKERAAAEQRSVSNMAGLLVTEALTGNASELLMLAEVRRLGIDPIPHLAAVVADASSK